MTEGEDTNAADMSNLYFNDHLEPVNVVGEPADAAATAKLLKLADKPQKIDCATQDYSGYFPSTGNITASKFELVSRVNTD